MPLNDGAKQLVNSENGWAIGTVMVVCRIVMQDGRLTTINEQAVFDEIVELIPAYLAEHVQPRAPQQGLRARHRGNPSQGDADGYRSQSLSRRRY
ncbi:hypothetical protein [Ensifer sp. Root127]|uniref:hypothetical protein n=1 Tax=Ensifer sp. Root127 TaxID=1736440 RepID=UPI00071126D6|nr:hypothetical protein [Ensifer sp. Root127]